MNETFAELDAREAKFREAKAVYESWWNRPPAKQCTRAEKDRALAIMWDTCFAPPRKRRTRRA